MIHTGYSAHGSFGGKTEMNKKMRRRKQFVDREVQGALVLRVVRYWLVSLFMVGVLTFVGWLYVYPGFGQVTGARAIIPMASPILMRALGSVALLLPIAVLDLISFSNRIVGPMLRLRRAMEELGEGQPVEPIHFRDGDFWNELADAFNVLRERVQGTDWSDDASTSTVMMSNDDTKRIGTVSDSNVSHKVQVS